MFKSQSYLKLILQAIGFRYSSSLVKKVEK
jgi:hypothetical protein